MLPGRRARGAGGRSSRPGPSCTSVPWCGPQVPLHDPLLVQAVDRIRAVTSRLVFDLGLEHGLEDAHAIEEAALSLLADLALHPGGAEFAVEEVLDLLEVVLPEAAVLEEVLHERDLRRLEASALASQRRGPADEVRLLPGDTDPVEAEAVVVVPRDDAEEGLLHELLWRVGGAGVVEVIVRRRAPVVVPGVHIIVDPKLSLQKAHDICHLVEEEIKKEIPEIKDITVHPEPK